MSELRITTDSLVQLAPPAHETRLSGGDTYIRDARHFAQIISAHIVEDEGPRFFVVHRFQVTQHPTGDTASDGVSAHIDWARHQRSALAVEHAEYSTLKPPTTDVLVHHMGGDHTRPRFEGAIPTITVNCGHELDQSLLSHVVVLGVVWSQKAANRSIDLRADAVVKGSRGALSSGTHCRKQLAVIERRNGLRRGILLRRARDNP
jgi:hypothetical protein